MVLTDDRSLSLLPILQSIHRGTRGWERRESPGREEGWKVALAAATTPQRKREEVKNWGERDREGGAMFCIHKQYEWWHLQSLWTARTGVL